MTKRISNLAASLLIIGLATQTFATQANAQQATTPTEACTDCQAHTEARQKRSAEQEATIKDLAEAIKIELLNQGIKLEKDDSKKSETAQVKAESDTELEALSCENEADKYDRAMCLAGNLDDIKEKIAEVPRGKERAKLTMLYNKAQRLIKNQLAESYNVSDINQRGEARERFDDLAGAVEDENNWKLNSDIAKLKKGLETEFSYREEVVRKTYQFDSNILPQLDQASYDLNMAAQTGDLNLQYRAQTRYDALMLQAQQYTKDIKRFDPTLRINSLERYADGSSLSYFETYYRESYENIMNNLRDLGMNNIDRGLNDYSRIGDSGIFDGSIRQSRGAGFSSITNMPSFGDIYNNSLVTPVDPTSSMYDNNFASNFLSNNPGVLRGSRGAN